MGRKEPLNLDEYIGFDHILLYIIQMVRTQVPTTYKVFTTNILLSIKDQNTRTNKKS